ncbi:hypothetical protein ACFQFH_14370 [Halobaculum halobium]|uniref:DUF8080 domain-containing protein n=1 Tax=Halobaculum halobium TaxID=3032281 RepID=A0ABD5THP7_9EURY|nr:hypothetical protein [Halobaculum sp. SYNS20]
MPVSLDSTVTTADGVALVAVRVRNSEPVARRVTVANLLSGPVLPPRRHGTPEPGWSVDGYAGVVDAHGELALGYACRVDGGAENDSDEADDETDGAAHRDAHTLDTEAPVELADVSDPSSAQTDSLADALADLADHRPPPDAVTPVTDLPAPPAPPDRNGEAPPNPTPDAAASTGGAAATSREEVGESTVAGPPPASAALPPAVTRVLDEADARVSRAETLATGPVADATAVLEAGVGPAGLAGLVADDARSLARIAERAESLAERADAVDVPTDTLERLA